MRGITISLLQSADFSLPYISLSVMVLMLWIVVMFLFHISEFFLFFSFFSILVGVFYLFPNSKTIYICIVYI